MSELSDKGFQIGRCGRCRWWDFLLSLEFGRLSTKVVEKVVGVEVIPYGVFVFFVQAARRWGRGYIVQRLKVCREVGKHSGWDLRRGRVLDGIGSR